MMNLQNGQVFFANGRDWTARHVPETADVDIVIADPHATDAEMTEFAKLEKINAYREKKGHALFPIAKAFPPPVVLLEEIERIHPVV